MTGGGPSTSQRPLNNEHNAIRLLTVQPLGETSGTVCCSLEIVSLEDRTHEYSDYLESNNCSGLATRRIVNDWFESRQATPGKQDYMPQPESVDFLVPSKDRMRFRWGDYAALSYVWGVDMTGTILLDGEIRTVTKNLEDALRAISRKDTFASDYRLWVDAVCINQKDEQECAHQVGKMREIYSQARGVLAWLGNAANESNDAFNLLRGLSSLDEEQKQHVGQALHANPSVFGRFCFYGLEKLMCRAYWYRLWIIQEIVLGSAATMLQCGDQFIDLPSFCRGLGVLYSGTLWTGKDSLLSNERRLRRLKPKPWTTDSIHLVYRSIRVLSEYEARGGTRQPLRRLLELSTSFCRDSRDKVFALLGMMEPEIVRRITAFHSLPTPDLFRETTIVFIEHYQNLEPLRDANPWGPTRTPSWVIDWKWDQKIPFSAPEKPFAGPFWDPDTLALPPESVYCAHRDRPASYSLSPDRQLLRCEGFVIDEICGLGAREKGYFHWEPTSVCSPPSGWESRYGPATAAAIYSVMLLGRVTNCERVSKRHSALLSLPRDEKRAMDEFARRGWSFLSNQVDYYFRWSEWWKLHESISVGDKTLSSFFSDTIPENAIEFDYSEVFNAAERANMSRRLMFTNKGYIGWAPDNAYGPGHKQSRIGDLVCIVFGCSTPLVIRPKNECFEVLGEAYVEGVMDGEAVDMLEAGGFERRTLTFC
ncbi:heterokaryon incompatibility protein-domain-containing protein [Thelonectria olida]|uniref:Heterokaryon incompatibility protein-domain-containing protein n=1 Tax=Thelonectria olida TaxID=1576542 RepID=A0A9P8VXP2_9HYPO|nr:heterokaryon incompatibility protein-domain-containing protein [Thelonectria olida]